MTDPIEKKSYTMLWFIVGSLFFLISLWAFYDEFISRRSWKGYQREFNRLELKKVEDEQEKAKQALDAEDKRRDQLAEPVSEDQFSLRRVRLKIEEAEVKMEGKEFKRLKDELKKRDIELSDAKQETGFAKADQDEVFYLWKHALLEGHEKEAEEKKKEYYELERRIAELKKVQDQKQSAVDEVQKKIDAYHDELKRWKTAEKKRLEPLDKLEKKIDAIKARGLDIQQVVIDDLGKGGAVFWGAVDRCESCHMAINRAGFEEEKQPFRTHPHREEIFGQHPIEKFGCTTCHAGQGRATQIEGKPLEEGDFVHGFVHHWLEPLLKKEWAQSTCNKCHQDQWKLDFAPVGMEGKKLFWNLGCTGCHAIQGFETAPKVAPSLLKVGSKVNEEWLTAWIRNPRDYLPHAKMPKVPLDADETGEPGQIEKVAAYVLQSSQPFDFPLGRYPGGDAGSGKRVFETVGCLGCHKKMSGGEAVPEQARSAVEGEAPSGSAGGGGDASPYKRTGLAPDLDKIAEKTSADWIYNWVQDPKIYNPEARMPDLRLTPQEAADITAYLMEQGKPTPGDAALRARLKDPENAKKGFLLISQYGCYGCHNIKGFEEASKLSVELTAFGKKEPPELDYGDTKIPRTWEDWTHGKIQNPRMYLTERTSSRMPNFQLPDEKIHSLVVWLKGLKKEEVPPAYKMSFTRPRQKEIDDGRRFTEHLNCKGCHMIEGEGRLVEAVVGEGKSPPLLMGIGARVRPDWMFKFLKDPSSLNIRTWLDIRMPTFHFNDDQANTVINYFSALDKVPSDFTTVPAQRASQESPESIAAGAKLASSDYFSCFSCHLQGGKTPPSAPEQWGPDLSLVRDRIRHDFIPEWVKDAQKFTPGVKMPAFLPTDDAAPQDVLGGNRQKQAEAIRDYLMSLEP